MEKILLGLFSSRLDQFESALQRLRQASIPDSRIQTLRAPEKREISAEDFFSAAESGSALPDPAADVFTTLCSWGLSPVDADHYVELILGGGHMVRVVLAEDEEQDRLTLSLQEAGAQEVLQRAQFAKEVEPPRIEECPPFLSLSEHPEFAGEPPSWEELKKAEEEKKTTILDQFKIYSGKFEDDNELPETPRDPHLFE